MAELKRIDPVSTGKMFGIFLAVIGFLIGLVVTAVSIIFATMMPALLTMGEVPGMGTGTAMDPLSAMGAIPFMPAIGFVGIGAVVIFPIIYGIIGFLYAAFAAAVYNFIAARIGGIRIDLG